ncbi:MAG: anaerobic sulfatase maturase [Fidelibacterota bacterium]|nr:MAG: anaerobic sulfatase maturase [Candidatus Neomarinimicrobiota bacterium]
MNSTSQPASRPFHVLAKPIGPICNLNCEHCFYLVKEQLYPDVKSFRMTEETLEHFIQQYIEGQPEHTPEVNFAWQGGEPTLLGVEFFQQAVELQERYRRPGLRISNSLQTNGVLLDDQWGAFLHEQNFLVGISIDGPEQLHDRYRRDRKGRGSFRSAMAGLEALKKHEVEFNTLTVVQNDNGDHPDEVYDFLKEIGSQFFQFIPIVEPEGDGKASYRSVGSEQYGRFLNRVFDHWLEQEDVGTVFVRDFDMLLGLVMGQPSSVCVHAETCGLAAAIEHNGDLYSCDHFVNKEDLLGNVTGQTISEMIDGVKQTEFGRDKRDTLPRPCRECPYLAYCFGGCPKDRLVNTPDGEPGLNYLCAGYKLFYSHTLPVMEKMAKCLRAQRPASDYHNIEAIVRDMAVAQGLAMGRNDPCPCGSGLKFKRCCGEKGANAN